MPDERRRPLGRGLGALLGRGGPGLVNLPVGAIRPNPYQPRRFVADERFQELVASVREHGILQPVVVSEVREGEQTVYRLVAGERRWRAAVEAGLTTIPAVVREATPAEGLVMALVENLQRADLNPLEEAEAFRELIDRFGLSQEEVARRVGRSRSAVANTLRLLEAAPEVRAALAAGEITEGHARALLGLGPGDQVLALGEVVRRGLNVRQTEELVRRWGEQPAEAPEGDDGLAALASELTARLGTRVVVRQNRRGAGRLVIHFYSTEQLNELLERLGLLEGSRADLVDS